MNNIRTRIVRLTAAAALVVGLGALGAGPAAAQSGVDIASSKRLAVGGTLAKDDTGSPEVTFRGTEIPEAPERQTALPLPQGELFAGLAVVACLSRPVRRRVRELSARHGASRDRLA